MSDPGPTVPTPDSPPARRSWWRPALAAAVLIVVGCAVATFVVLRSDGGDDYPESWDARIQPYVDIVEEQRGLTFDHPVAVHFLDDEAFEKTVRTDADDLDDEDKKELQETTSLFRAFGLISGDVDLFDAVNDASGSGTLAYYSFDDHDITVRGTTLTLAVRATLVHELTHALQDQHFDVADRLEKLDKKAADGEPTTAGDALQAIVEGDAERVADLYRTSLSAAQQKALQKAETADTADNTAALKSVPAIITTLIGAPYTLGEVLTQVVSAGGEHAIDDLFTDPPTDDSVLVNPLNVLGDGPAPTTMDVPAPAKGEKKFDSGQVGDLVTYLMLAQRIPPRTALAAADTWDGDAYLGFRRGDALCARVTYATRSPADAARLTSALDRWIDAGPSGSHAKVTGNGNLVTFESCDPGKKAKGTKDTSTDALNLVATRAYLGAQAVQSGASPTAAQCLSGKLVDAYSVAELTDPEAGVDRAAIQKRIQTYMAACRSQ